MQKKQENHSNRYYAGLIIGLIALSGDLGVALVFVAVMALMLLCTGMSPWYAAGGLGLVALAAPILWNRLIPYQQKRILVISIFNYTTCI